MTFLAGAAAVPAFGQIDVLTERYDDARLGANLSETVLTTSNVGADTFGKLWSYTVSGSVYAQPLYVRNVAIPGQGTHDVLYVVTMNDVVYAFDADAPDDAPLLSVDLTSQVAGSTPVSMDDVLGYVDNIAGNLGIESTPHIDLSTHTMYLVARTREMGGTCAQADADTPNPTFCQRLHALDIRTLEEKPNSPVVLGGHVAGSGSGSSGGVLRFDPKIQNQRASLALANGRVFIAWASHSDQFHYNGWVMAYDAATLQQTAIWASAPDDGTGHGAGIWMSGRAPAVDAQGNVYYSTGNALYDGNTNFGDTLVKFGSTPDTPLLDWMTPSNYADLRTYDLDLSGSGPILIPGTDLIVIAGKSGVFYATHTGDMGHVQQAGDVNIAQSFSNGGQQIKGGPVYWNRSGGAGPWMYVWSDSHNALKAYHFDGSLFDTTPVSQSVIYSGSGSAGGVLTLSANGSTPGSGIVWSSMGLPTGPDPNSGVNRGMLRALNADDLTQELWNSEQNSARDSLGNWPKFSAPTVVGGRVYMASFPSDGVGDTKVSVYGLLPHPDFSLAVAPANPGVAPGGSVVYTVTPAALDGFSGTIHLSVAGLPDGAAATFASEDLVPPATTTLTVRTSAATPLAQHLLTVTGQSGDLAHDAEAGLYVTDVTPGAGAIGVDFVGGATAMAATEAGGVLARPNWNEAAAAAGSGLALLDETGSATGATLDWDAPAAGTLGLADAPGDVRLMNGYLDAAGSATTRVTVANLPAEPAGYYVYVYADGANGQATRSADYAVEGGGTPRQSIAITDAAGADFAGSYVRSDGGAGNYAVFFVGGTGFTLTATPAGASDGDPHAPLNAIQIVRGDRIFADGFD